MGLFRPSEEKNEERELDQKLAKVRFFPGSVREYESLVGYQVKIIDTGNRDIAVKYAKPDECKESFERKKLLVEANIEALVRCSPNEDATTYNAIYGLPVARKDDDPYRGR